VKIFSNLENDELGDRHDLIK